MHIAVIGAGNMGSLYGANLARAGAQVTFVDPWREHVDAIRKYGLKMDGLHGEFVAKAHATTDAAEVKDVDMALVMVNNYTTSAAAQSARQILKEDGFVLTLQNGLGNIEVLQGVLGEERVMAGLSFHSADLKSPGHVSHTNESKTYLGELDKSESARLKTLTDWMRRAEMHPVVESDITATIWGKFVHNCGLNALCAITDLRPGHIGQIAELDQLQTHIIEEALALVAARGIKIPEENPLQAVKEYGRRKFHRVSMLQHLARGKETEIDALNGYIVRESRKLGLACPYNEALTALIKGRQYIPQEEGEHDPN